MTNQCRFGLIVISTCIDIISFVFVGWVPKKVSILEFRSTDIRGGKIELIFKFQKQVSVTSKQVVQSLVELVFV